MDVSALIDVKPNPHVPTLNAGDTVRVKAKVVEGDKERIQVFQGVVIKVKRGGAGASFTVRRVAYGIGVERTFPVYSPLVDSVEVVRHGKVRRARLYYLRGLSTKASRIKEKRMDKAELLPTQVPAEAEVAPPVPTEAQAPAEAQPQAQAEAQAEVAPPVSAEAPAPAEVQPQPQAQAQEQAAPPAQAQGQAQPKA